MPNMFGGDSTGREYAPHMWILPFEGDPDNDDDYVFVGNTGSVSIEIESKRYRIGAAALGELVCEASILSGDYLVPNTFLGGLRILDIPQPVLQMALDKALDANAAMPDRQQLIISLLHSIPDFAGIEVDFPVSVSISEIFDPASIQESIRASMDAFDHYINNLRTRLGFEIYQ